MSTNLQINGHVTVNGNIEVYENGSIKVIGNQNHVSVNVIDLQNFIEDKFKYSSNKEYYLEAANIIKDSKNQGKIKKALLKLNEMSNELGKNILFSGVSQLVYETIKELVKNS